MSNKIRIIHYEEQAVGRRIKSTKKRYTWKFALDDHPYQIDLFVSKFSGKKVLKVDGEKLYEGKKEGKIFHRSLEINGHNIIIIEVGKGFDLRIDGVSFNIISKQSNFHSEFTEGMMSNVLIPDFQEDWEKSARPYEIIIREGLNVTNREKLPIVKKSRGRSSVKIPSDDRYYNCLSSEPFSDFIRT
jgi:hypothetical protein